MPVRVDVKGYGTVEFEDGYSIEQQNAAIERAISDGRLKPLREPLRERKEGERLVGSGEAALLGLKRGGAGIVQGLSSILAPGVMGTVIETPMNALKDYMQGQERQFHEKYGEDPVLEGIAFGTQLGTEILPLAFGGGAVNLLKSPQIVSNLLRNSSGLAKALGSLSGVFGKNAAFSASAAPFMYEPTFEKPAGEKALEAGLLGGVLGTGIAGLAHTSQIPQLPAKLLSMFGDKQTAEKIIPQLEGLETSLSEAISSPTLKRFEEVGLAGVPFSGIPESQYRTGKILEKEGESLLNTLSYPHGDAGVHLKKNLKETTKNIKSENTANYKERDQLADELGVKVIAGNYQDTARQIAKSILEGKEFGGEIATGVGPKLNKFISDIASFSENKSNKIPEINIGGKTLKYDDIPKVIRDQIEHILNPESAEPIFKIGSITGAQTTASRLESLSNKEALKGDNYLASIYGRMGSALRDDVTNSIESSNNDKLLKLHEKANTFYKENVVPLDDPDIKRFTKGRGDADTLVNFFIRQGKDDRAELLKKLTTNLSEKDKGILGRAFLDKARKEFEGEQVLQPKAMVNMFNNLGENTRNELFSKDFIDKMKRYSIRVQKNPAAAEAMFVPKTGVRAAEAAGLASLGTSLAVGNMPAFLKLLGTFGGANQLAKFLRSEQAREMYLRGGLPLTEIPKRVSSLGSAAAGSTPAFTVVGLNPDLEY